LRLVLAQHPAGKNRAGHKEEVPADVAECPAVVYFYLLAEPFSRIDTQLRLPGQIQVTTSLSTPNDWFWPEAEKYDIPLMLFAPGQNAVFTEIARTHPNLRMIIDHMNLNREKDDDAVATIESLIPMAEFPNVSVKVSSIPLYSTEPYPYRNLHPVLERLIRAFGPERSFWGTDLTRIWALIESYRQCVTVFTEEMDFLSADDLEWVMGKGLTRFLRWTPQGA